MTRLTPLVVAGNAIFYFIMAAAYCQILKRRFSWPVTLFGFLIGFWPISSLRSSCPMRTLKGRCLGWSLFP